MRIVYEHAIRYYRGSQNQSEWVKEWVNRQTDKGYTALHFAACHNNIDMISYLLSTLEADCYAKSRQG